MASNDIEQLPEIPIEIQYLIIEEALLPSNYPSGVSSGNQFNGDDYEFLRGPPKWPDTRPSMLPFPYNFAEVCILWRNYLKNKPGSWNHLVFDVASDPWRYIGSFAWSKDIRFNVLVYDSASSSQNDAQLERTRASRIMKALIPHMERCMSISFDLKFTSSLPTPMEFFCHSPPVLGALLLNGQIDDLDTEQDFIQDFLGDEEAKDKLFVAINNAMHIALPGSWFLHLSTHPSTSEWLPLFLGRVWIIVINGFAFHEHGNFTMAQLVNLIIGLKPMDQLVFRNLSLSYPFFPPPAHSESFRCWSEVRIDFAITFNGVSQDFISSLWDLVLFMDDYKSGSICFAECSILVIRQKTDMRWPSGLGLHRVSASSSLMNAVSDFTGESLKVSEYSFFNDDFLLWLNGREGVSITDELRFGKLRASNINFLQITNCPNISLDALYAFFKEPNRLKVVANNACYRFRPFIYAIATRGTSPQPKPEDLTRFEKIGVHFLDKNYNRLVM